MSLTAARLGPWLSIALPAGLTMGLAFAWGGFFPDVTSIAVVATLAVLAGTAAATRRLGRGLSRGFTAAAVALIVFVAWTLVSGSWSHAPARATLSYDLNLLYASLFIVVGLGGRSTSRARGLLWGVAFAVTAISIAAAASWLLPHVFPTSLAAGRLRLGWPTSYWNATGLIAGTAVVCCVGMTASASQPAPVRVLATMAAPLCAGALIFTASRGALAVTVLGLVLVVGLIRSTATPGGLAAIAPALGAAVLIALRVSGLSVDSPKTRAIYGGERAASLLVAVALGAGALRVLLLRLDGRLAHWSPPWTRRQFRAALGLGLALLAMTFVIARGPQAVGRAVHTFVSRNQQSVAGGLAASERLTRVGGNGRIDEWRVAWRDGLEPHPVLGTGAGTYATLWTRYGPSSHRVLNAHSLYLEEFAELGLVGGGLIIASVLAMLVALLRRACGPDREAWAVLAAGAVMWALHAGVDWDWQMPAVTAWVFAAGALALAGPADRSAPPLDLRIRAVIALGALALCVTPALVWRSQTTLIEGVTAFERGNCLTAERDALASAAALSSRPEPYELIAYCEAGDARYALALNAIQAAEQRDPHNWELRYSDALIRAAAGLDPRSAARLALALYPTSILTRAAARVFGHEPRREWRRFAVAAPLPVPRATVHH